MADNVCCVTCSSEQHSGHCQLQCKKLPPLGRGGAVISKPAVENNNPATSATSIDKPAMPTVIHNKKSHQTLPWKILTMLHQKISPYPHH